MLFLLLKDTACFLTGYGSAGLFALILKVGFNIHSRADTACNIFYLQVQNKKKLRLKQARNSKKMMADDLD